MVFLIRRRKKEDCFDIQKIITKTWQETYEGIINETYLNELSNNENMSKKKYTFLYFRIYRVINI